MYRSIEICAGAGGQALGLEMAGFSHTVLVEYEKDYCECLKKNRPAWNVLGTNFDTYRAWISGRLNVFGYNVHIQLLNASDYGVPQLRPRVVIIGVRTDMMDFFEFPQKTPELTLSVGEVLYDLMSAEGWNGVDKWKRVANKIAPTLVGGSKKHGGPDLGPTRAKKAWAELGVDGKGIANAAPEVNFEGMPRLTSKMLARLQGFPDSWDFGKRKTVACRMIGNAFPPPVAMKVGLQIKKILDNELTYSRSKEEISSGVAV